MKLGAVKPTQHACDPISISFILSSLSTANSSAKAESVINFIFGYKHMRFQDKQFTFKVFIRVRETNDYAFQPFELARAFHARLSGIGARDTAALTEHGRSFGS